MPAHNKLVTTINVVPSVGVDADDEVGLMLMPGFVVPLFHLRTRVKILLTVLQSQVLILVGEVLGVRGKTQTRFLRCFDQVDNHYDDDDDCDDEVVFSFVYLAKRRPLDVNVKRCKV